MLSQIVESKLHPSTLDLKIQKPGLGLSLYEKFSQSWNDWKRARVETNRLKEDLKRLENLEKNLF